MTRDYESRIYFQVATAGLILNQNYLVFAFNLNICSKRVQKKFTFWIIIMDIFTSWINRILCIINTFVLLCLSGVIAQLSRLNCSWTFEEPIYHHGQYFCNIQTLFGRNQKWWVNGCSVIKIRFWDQFWPKRGPCTPPGACPALW